MEPLPLLSTLRLIKTLFQGAFSKVIPIPEPVSITTLAFTPKTPYDYACPSAVKIFNQYKKDGEAFGVKSPKELASKVVSEIGWKILNLLIFL